MVFWRLDEGGVDSCRAEADGKEAGGEEAAARCMNYRSCYKNRDWIWRREAGTFMVRRREDIVFSGRWPEPGVDALDIGARLKDTMTSNKSERV